MAVAFDAATESVRTGTGDPHTFSHTGRAEASGGVQGVVLVAIHGTSATNHITGAVTYGGVVMHQVCTATDTSTEPGRADIWFVGDNLSGLGGTQTVSIDLASATGDDFQFVCITLTGNTDIEPVSWDKVEQNAADPSVTLPYYGRTCISIGALYSGLAADTDFTVNANCTKIAGEDLGNFAATTLRQTTPGSSDFAIGGTSLSDDVAYVACSFSELATRTASYPNPVEVFNSGEAVNRTSFSVLCPGAVSGDRLIAVIIHGTSTDDGGDAPANWTKLTGTDQGLSIYERIFTSTVAAGPVTFTQDSSNWWAAQVIKITGSGGAAAQLATRASGSSTAPDTSSLTPSGGAKNYLWISTVGYGHALGTDRNTTVYPTGYTVVADSDPSGDFGQVRLATGWKQANASSENPGAFTISGSLAWIGYTIAIAPPEVTTLSPGAGSITTTRNAPTLRERIFPGAATISTVRNSVVLHERLFPGIGSLAITGFTPIVTVGAGGTTLTPGSLLISLTAQAATLKESIFPGAGSLALSGQAPTLRFTLFPGIGSLSLSGQQANLHERIFPGAGGLTLSAQQPATTIGTVLYPGAGSLVITGQTAALVFNYRFYPGAGSLALTGQAPSLRTTIFPGTGSLAISGQTPQLVFGTILYPGAGALALTGFTPVIAYNYIFYPGIGSLGLTANAASLRTTIFPGTGGLTLTGQGSTLHERLFPGAGSLVLTGYTTIISIIALTLGEAVYAPIAIAPRAVYHPLTDDGLAVYAPTAPGAGVYTALVLGEAVYAPIGEGVATYRPLKEGEATYG